MIIDSHCHLDYEPMYSSLDDVISRADKSQIKYILTISVKDNKYKNILEILKKYPKVYGTYGIHPHEAKNHKEIKKNIILEKISYSKKIIGIGETGLDFFHNHSDEKDQIRLFEEHIMASIESNLPLIVHSRNAEEKTFEILSTYSKDKELKILSLGKKQTSCVKYNWKLFDDATGKKLADNDYKFCKKRAMTSLLIRKIKD